MRILTITDMAINLTNPQTNERIAALPGKLVEMIYGTNFSPNEIRRGYLLSTATNATAPDLGMTKGYALFYESNSTATNATASISSISNNLPAPTQVGQVLDSFELIAALPQVTQQPSIQQVAQSDEVTQDTTNEEVDTDADEDNEREDNGRNLDDCENIGGTSCADDYDSTADD